MSILVSFCINRPGLKQGYYIPFRLCLIDGMFAISSLPAALGGIFGLLCSYKVLDVAGIGFIWRNEIGFYLYSILAIWALAITCQKFLCYVLLCVFRVSRLIDVNESKHFPLRVTWQGMDPWPDSWQKAKAIGPKGGGATPEMKKCEV